MKKIYEVAFVPDTDRGQLVNRNWRELVATTIKSAQVEVDLQPKPKVAGELLIAERGSDWVICGKRTNERKWTDY